MTATKRTDWRAHLPWVLALIAGTGAFFTLRATFIAHADQGAHDGSEERLDLIEQHLAADGVRWTHAEKALDTLLERVK